MGKQPSKPDESRQQLVPVSAGFRSDWRGRTGGMKKGPRPLFLVLEFCRPRHQLADQMIDLGDPGQCLQAVRHMHDLQLPPLLCRLGHHCIQTGQAGAVGMFHAGQIKLRYRTIRQGRLDRLGGCRCRIEIEQAGDRENTRRSAAQIKTAVGTRRPWPLLPSFAIESSAWPPLVSRLEISWSMLLLRISASTWLR